MIYSLIGDIENEKDPDAVEDIRKLFRFTEERVRAYEKQVELEEPKFPLRVRIAESMKSVTAKIYPQFVWLLIWLSIMTLFSLCINC